MELDADLKSMLRESVRLELYMASLYLRLAHRFPEHYSFWWRLCLEEEGHAALLRSFENEYLPAALFPKEMLDPDSERLGECNRKLDELIARFDDLEMSEAEFCQLALSFEETSIEYYFEKALSGGEQESRSLELVRSLNDGSEKHVQRLREFRAKLGE